MDKETPSDSSGSRLLRHVRSRIFSGLLILIPAGATFIILRLIFNLLQMILRPLNDLPIWKIPEPVIPVLTFSILLFLVYLTGVATKRMFGRKMVGLFERILLHVPIVKSIYGASKQVIEAVRTSNRKAFKAVAVIEFPKEGSYALAFVTGDLEDQNGDKLVSVFLPTTPNPTSGYLLVLREEQVIRTGLSVEEGIKMIISGGVLVPSKLTVPTARKQPPA